MDRLIVVVPPIAQSNGFLENTLTASQRQFKLHFSLCRGYMQILQNFPGGCVCLKLNSPSGSQMFMKLICPWLCWSHVYKRQLAIICKSRWTNLRPKFDLNVSTNDALCTKTAYKGRISCAPTWPASWLDVLMWLQRSKHQ